jgi:DNA-binding winged helix-turn-helix (wHTH) protein
LFARRFERFAICDCAGISGPIDFAGRTISALASESQAAGDAIAVARLRLHATQAEPSSWSRVLLETWKSRQEHALLVFDHAEAIGENAAALSLLGDLLAARPSERVVLISARNTLPLRNGHYFAPHQVLTLSQHELRLDDEEARAVFEGTDVAPATVERMIKTAGGWPALLMLLAVFSRYDATMDDLLDRLQDVPAGSVHEFLAGEVIAALTPDMMSALLAIAAIPNASLEDVFAATGLRHATPVVDQLLHLPGFLSAHSGAYRAHPLLLAELRAGHRAELTTCLARAALVRESFGDLLRAAELYLAEGNETAAASALDRLPASTLERPSSRLIEAMTKVDVETLCARPNLWMALLPYRHGHVDPARLYDEGLRLLRLASADETPPLQRRLRVHLATLATQLERLTEATALIDAALGDSRAGASGEDDDRLALMTMAEIAAKEGRFAQCDVLADRSEAAGNGTGNVQVEATRARIWLEKATLFGRFDDVLKTCDETLYAAQRSGITSRIVDAARAVASAAWYCNDEERAESASRLLEDCGDVDMRAFARYVAALLDRKQIEAPVRVMQLARWHAAMLTADRELAQELFDAIIDGSGGVDTLQNVFLRIVVRVSAALLLPGQRRRLLEARIIAAGVESPPLQASLELLIDSSEPADYGIFRYLAARIARSPLKERSDALSLDVVRGEVRRGTEPLHVSDRGLELLSALALLPAGTSKEELAAAIWTGLDGEDAINALKMCVSRTRAQLGEKDAILSTKRGYALNERVAVDVREYERLLRSVRGADGLSDTMRRQVVDAEKSLAALRRATGHWTWFEAHEERLAGVRAELGSLISKQPARHDEATAIAPA